MGNNIVDYARAAGITNMEDITPDEDNARALRRIERNDPDFTDVWVQQHRDVETDFCPAGARDLGWLGHFIGRSRTVQNLSVRPIDDLVDTIEPFCRGVGSNRSIRSVRFSHVHSLGEIFTMMGEFFRSNHNLTELTVIECDFGEGGSRSLSSALAARAKKSLQSVSLASSGIGDEQLVDVAGALSRHPELRKLHLTGNVIRLGGCVALATLLKWSATEMQDLDLARNDIVNEGVEALAPALANSNLRRLNLSHNPSITTRGWRALSTLLECPCSSLEELWISACRVDNEGAIIVAKALRSNRRLKSLYIQDNPMITSRGWSAFSRALCDASSINSTYLSNHTLKALHSSGLTGDVLSALRLSSRGADAKEVRIIKILDCHREIDVVPLFEYDLRALPLVVDWFARADSCVPWQSEASIPRRKLSAVYRFVRGMPMSCVAGRPTRESAKIEFMELD